MVEVVIWWWKRMLHRPDAPKHIVTELRVPGRGPFSKIFNSQLQQNFNSIPREEEDIAFKWTMFCPSIVELTAWNCGCKVVGAGRGGHQRWNKHSSWRSPTGLGRDQVTARKVDVTLAIAEAKNWCMGRVWCYNETRQDFWLVSKQFWQTVRELRRGKWRPTYTVWSAVGMLLTSTKGTVMLWKEYFEDFLNPAVVLCCTHLCSIWRRHSTTLGYPVGGASAIWCLLLVSDPLLWAIWSLYHSKSLVWVRLLGDSGCVCTTCYPVKKYTNVPAGCYHICQFCSWKAAEFICLTVPLFTNQCRKITCRTYCSYSSIIEISTSGKFKMKITFICLN